MQDLRQEFYPENGKENQPEGDTSGDETCRAAAVIMQLLARAASQGHAFIFRPQLMESLDLDFQLDWETIENAIERLSLADEIVVEPGGDQPERVYRAAMHRAETGIADRLEEMLAEPPQPPLQPAEKLASKIESRFAVRLSEEQSEALKAVLYSRVSVITGGPGTGKTTLIRAVEGIFSMTGSRVCLAAPTGRAARRLSEITARQAHTIHKLLGYHLETESFDRGRENPIEADVLIIDEASMIDAELMYHLLCATKNDSRLILVGDVFQLPPVGPGNVLSDIIDSGAVAVRHLTEIFRQAAKSAIVRNAHHIRAGKRPELPAFAEAQHEADFLMAEAESAGQAAAAAVDICVNRLPQIYGLVPGKDIQVLAPVHKGPAGTMNLNRELQKAINPGDDGISGDQFMFKTGDRVMHLKNDYTKMVFNGDIGNIDGIDPFRQVLRVDYYGRQVSYEAEELENLTLGYAISVHKSQGSEYPAVILPLITSHYIMLQRNLLYTAITRASRLVVLVGSSKAVNIALKNNSPAGRLSGLAERLVKTPP